ncbi:MAG: isopenicillin N synthase family oxygenase [Chitinophagaceae bacterium]|nr:MAG: isopenicillin N synthase family oxygenase [Chitinophagaceae bacterium]
MQENNNIVPVVDLSEYTNGTPEQKAAFVKKLGNAYEDVGFVSVINHGIDKALIDSFYDKVQKFFALPTEIKKKYEVPGLSGQRGYTSFGKEHAKHSNVADLKEFWQFGQEIEGDDEIGKDYPSNVEVEEMPDFNKTGITLYKNFENAGNKLLTAIAEYLNLEADYFDDKIFNGNSILRAIHYPPITSEPESAIRAEQHEDINLITLLVGASAEGLQLLNKKGEWQDVVAKPGAIIVNVGDMLQRLTNNKLRSTTHRVVNPPREKWHTSRFSIPFFLHPRSEMRLDCLDNCIDASNPKAYDPISAGEYLDQRLIEIGLKK